MPFDIHCKLHGWLVNAGFIKVEADERHVPVGGWPDHPEERRLRNQKPLEGGLEVLSLPLMISNNEIELCHVKTSLNRVQVGPHKVF